MEGMFPPLDLGDWMSEKLLLIDGHSMINRAFYGVPPLTNSAGEHTNAVYGFFNILFSVMDSEKPDYMMVAFDLKAPTFRHKIFDAYKGTRKPMPEELREQVPVVKQVLTAMGIVIMSKEGYEADDILGTMARRGEAAGMDVCILSGDRDLLQLATEKIKIRLPRTKGGKTEIDDFYAKDVLEKYQVTPLGIIELKALMGDTADNIPGVPKVGEKTATELVKTYGTIENLKLHREELTKKSIRETLMENFDKAELSKVLATIDVNADIPFEINEGKLTDIYTEKAYELFRHLEFKNMLSRFNSDNIQSANIPEDIFKTINDLTQAEQVFEEAMKAELTAVYPVFDSEVFLGAVICNSDGEVSYIVPEGFISEGYIADKLAKLYSNAHGKIAAFALKEQLVLLEKYGIELSYRAGIYDLKVMAYLCNPLKSEYSLEDIGAAYLNIAIPSYKESFGKASLSKVFEEDEDKLSAYACSRAYICFKSFDLLLKDVEKLEMSGLLEDIELPLIFTLRAMEREGILVKPDELKAYGDRLSVRINELEKSIYEQAQTEFNINSPKQLGEVLFEKLGLPGGKKTKTGYSTAAEVLEKLAEDNAVVKDILEYRALTKLKSTYADGLSAYIDETNRIHCTFHQTITATGRLSCADPNLQNIPVRTELGRELRKIFVPHEGCVFIDADYSQIELRILACMSGDEKLIAAYNQDQDIHRITASQVFNVPFEEVTPELRRNAKAVNFGIVYGISSFGLSQDLSIDRKEAKQYIENYFATYPGVKAFLDGLVNGAKEKGYVTTMYGRRRPVPEIANGNFMQRQFGERVAMNAPVQGTAADIMKIAMLRVDRRLKESNLRSKLILQVHDEILVEAPYEEREQAALIIKEEMMGAAKLAVELLADVKSGNSWYEAH